MSRLFSLAAPSQQVATVFGADPALPVSIPSETIEGDAGVVVIDRDGRRLLKTMTWGFPRHTRESRLRGESPARLGLVADLTNPMWEQLVVDPRYRCLIPLTHFANPAGEAGSKTRTWFSLVEQPVAAWAGFCRNTPEFGPVFAGMTMTASALVQPYNDRMPALLVPHEYERWLTGTIQDVIGFQFRDPPADERLAIHHTDDRWRSGRPPSLAEGDKPQMALAL